MRHLAIVVSFVGLAWATPVPDDPPSGIGTGVTIAIAPPGGSPSGCAVSWNGPAFGIAAVNLTGNVRNIALESTVLPTATVAYMREEASLVSVGTAFTQGTAVPWTDFDVQFPEVTPAPSVLESGDAALEGDLPAVVGANRLVKGVAAAGSDDTTVTVRRTSTHTKTVTLNRSSSSAVSVEAPPPAPKTSAAPPPPPPSDSSEAAVGCKKPDSLTLTLKDGILKDSQNRIGYIASNRQFQFDGPPQAGALLTAGFSVCNGSLALGPSTTFYQCRSGGFFNLYDRNVAPQCNPVRLQILSMKDC